MAARPRPDRILVPLLLALAFPGCGGSGGTGGATPPTADVLFPPGACMTSEPQILVRGTATGNGAVASVTVNGVPASSSDGFATWTAAVPLSPGVNALVVSVTDTGGASAPSADTVSVRRDGPVPQQAANAVFVPSANAVVFTDPELGVFSVHLATGVRTVLSGPGRGTGVPYRAFPRSSFFGAVGVQAAASRAIVADFTGLLSIDLVTGDRSILSDSTHGAGPSLVNSIEALALDTAGNRVFVCRFSGQIQSVDLTSGDRTAIAGTVGSGTALVSSDDLAFDAATGLLYVLDGSARSIVAVDPTTLVRTAKSSPTLGTGAALSSASSRLALDAAGNRVFVFSPTSREIVSVDLASGNRVVVASPSIGTGRALSEVVDLTWQAGSSRLLAPLATGGVLAVDPTTGDRSLLQEFTFGSPTARIVEDVALSPLGTQVLFVDSLPLSPTLVAHDLATGTEHVVADDVVGTGPILDGQAALTYAPDGSVAYAELGAQVVRVDLSTGDRTVVSDAGTGSGPALDVHDLAEGPTPGTLSALDSTSGLVQIDVATGNRSVVAPVSAFGSLGASTALAVDAATGRRYVANDDEDDQVFETDPAFPGIASPFTSIGLGTPSPFDGDIDGCAFDGRSSRLFVVGETSPILVRIDPTADVSSVHSGGGAGVGPFLSLRRIDGSRTRGVLVVGAGGGILAIDALTGERVLLLLTASRLAGQR